MPYGAGSVKQVPEPVSPRYGSRVLGVSCRYRSHSGKHEPEFHTGAGRSAGADHRIFVRHGEPGKGSTVLSRDFRWSGRRDLNPRPQRPERCALTKLRYFPVDRLLV